MTGNGAYDSHLHGYCYSGSLCYNIDYKLVFIGLSLDLTMNKLREIHLHISCSSLYPLQPSLTTGVRKWDVLRREDESKKTTLGAAK